MTISIQISVNGNYKLPVSYQQGDRVESHVISGFGMDGPNVHYVNFSHGPDAMTLAIGPEEPDNGTVDPAPVAEPDVDPEFVESEAEVSGDDDDADSGDSEEADEA